MSSFRRLCPAFACLGLLLNGILFADGRSMRDSRQQPGSITVDQRNPEIRWAYIPAGTFLRGCVPGDTDCFNDESPRHAVTISRPFELMTTEVTIAMVRAAGTTLPAQPAWNTSPRQPAVNLTWFEAADFCRAIGGRLPTEAEWERAARAGKDGAKRLSGEAALPLDRGRPLVNTADESARRVHRTVTPLAGYNDGYPSTAPVGSFPANAWGLFDMDGNVSEWMADWDGRYTASAATDPKGPAEGEYRIVRSGSWGREPIRALRISFRSGNFPTSRIESVGARCARP